MKIRFRVDGGLAVFPGLARPVTIDVDALPAADAKRIATAVDACRFFDRPAPAASAAPGAADMRRYEVAIDDGGRSRTLSIPEAVDDTDLKALVTLLEKQRELALRR